MKPIVLISFSIFAAMCFLNSCHKDNNPIADDTVCDYLPLKVGTKYLYHYSDGAYGPGWPDMRNIGECEWTIVNRSATPPYSYVVMQYFNGIHIINDYYFGSDTTKTSYIMDSIIITENGNRLVTIKYSVPYGGYHSENVERYFECSKIDTCFSNNYGPQFCLTKNVGIKSLSLYSMANHTVFESYTLIKGPY
jgi:hypothetical protein